MAWIYVNRSYFFDEQLSNMVSNDFSYLSIIVDALSSLLKGLYIDVLHIVVVQVYRNYYLISNQ